MRMFVRVNVSHRNAGRLKLANLSGSLSFDLTRLHAAGQSPCGKRYQPTAKTCGLRMAGSQGLYATCLQHRLAVDQNHVTAHTQLRKLLRQDHGVVEGRSLRHQRGGSYDAAGVGLDDGTVHPGRVPEVVGVNNQSSHRASLAGSSVGSGAGLTPFSPLPYTR